MYPPPRSQMRVVSIHGISLHVQPLPCLPCSPSDPVVPSQGQALVCGRFQGSWPWVQRTARLGQSRGRELAPLLPARMGLSPEGCRALCSDVSRHQRCCSDTAPSALRAEGWWSGGWKEPGRPSPVQASTEPSVACLARLHGPSPSGASPTWTLCTSWCASSHTGALFPLLQPEGHMSAVSLGPCPLETPGLQTRSELVPWGRRSHGSWCQDGRDRAQHKTP